MEDRAAQCGEQDEDLRATERAHLDRLRRVLEEERDLSVLDQPEVTRHDRDGDARPRDRDRILSTAAQREEPANTATAVELPSARRRTDGLRRHLDPIRDREARVQRVA